MASAQVAVLWLIVGIILIYIVLGKCHTKSTGKCYFLPHTEFQQKVTGSIFLFILFAFCITQSEFIPMLFNFERDKPKTKDPASSPLDKYHELCHWQIHVPGCDFSWLRGDSYYTPIECPKDAIITDYNIYHFVLYFLGTFLCPSFFWAFLVAGFWWEILEVFIECWDIGDLFYNLTGLLLGLYARRKLDEKYAKRLS